MTEMSGEGNALWDSLERHAKSHRMHDVFGHDAIRTVRRLPPSEWESLREFVQQRVREATGEPMLIVHFEIPKGER